MSDTIELSTEQTVEEIAEECDVGADELLEFIADSIEEAYDMSEVDVIEQMLGTEELN